ncbi:MAG: hypothetical protein HETSPECPRED_003569 [Heterodermia speciosa]|uniref:C3H1-type domain-containing protein n=1 Tax=Heterodermia speciosa TaxID=116794 RepID=A0A8H3IL69_9LECA|nr:MAG: hypothetical protein HETSPECPRED_003569 [Heterodermia speciosa]
MATFLPPSQASHPDPPPDQAMFASHGPPRGPNSTFRSQHRGSGDYRSNGAQAFADALPTPVVPQPQMSNGAPRHRSTISGPTFDGPRSPPNTKSNHHPESLLGLNPANQPFADTSHVPCKFFRSGQCQAGKACPFSHSTDISTVDTPCKYFAKGNCKFGAKCALAHILPNGRRVNRPYGATGGQLNLGGRVDPQTYHHQNDSALAHSLLAQQANGGIPTFGHPYPQLIENDYGPPANVHRPYEIPTVETGYASHSGSAYGSPREDNRLPLSPVAHLSALDAPMPASFDSQGISYMARHGPVAASVPSKFGIESPPSSLPRKAVLPSDTVRNVSESAYGRDARSRASNMGSSPLGSGDEGLGQRIMHSQRVAKAKMLSASLPRVRANDEWDDQFLFGGEEDFLPTSLHELLTPQEKMRRLSRTDHDAGSHRENLSGIGSPAEASSKFGSPNGASPSRYNALFARQKREEEGNNMLTSAFGHVGSPLRNHSLQPGTSPGLRATSNPAISGDVSPHFASPPRHSSMSALSQQLSHTRLASRTDNPSNEPTNGLHPGSALHHNQSNGRLDRVVSSSSIGTSRIDEEQGDCVFRMEEEEENHNKRLSSGWHSHSSGGRTSPRPGAIGGGRQSEQKRGKTGEGYWP